MQEVINRAKALLADGTVVRVLAWKAGDLGCNPEPAFFNAAEELDNLVYNDYCGANLSKYMIEAGKQEGKTLVFLKPCDTYSYNQLIKEHRVDREKAYIIGIGCDGKLDVDEKLNNNKEVTLEKCLTCKGKEHKVYDELLMANEENTKGEQDRFALVAELEAMTPQERFAFWQKELSKCIRCNACRNVCPACSCRKCVFDSDKFDSAQKANVDSFEEQMFHIIRAFHVAGRCTDCGECSRVCPQGIPIHLLNRKFIKDINAFYGEYQAGEDTDSRAPLTNFTFDDVEPSIVKERG